LTTPQSQCSIKHLQKTTAGTAHVKFGIYSVNNADKHPVTPLSTSSAVDVASGGFAWYDFDNNVACVNGTNYSFQFNQDASVDLKYEADADASKWSFDAGCAYGTWLDPFVVDGHATAAMAVYATYTPTAGGPKKGSNLSNTMITMLNSKMLFSQCNRFPKLCPRQF